MLQSDQMTHLDAIEAAAANVGFTSRRQSIRELVFIQILEANDNWVLFDPIRQGKDVSKMLYAAAKKAGNCDTELEFRTWLLNTVKNHDFTIS